MWFKSWVFCLVMVFCSLFIVTIASVHLILAKVAERQFLRQSLDDLHKRIEQNIKQADSWHYAVVDEVHHPELECLRKNSTCRLAVPFSLVLYDKNGQTFFSGSNGSQGFYLSGQACAEPGAFDYSADCPLNYTITGQLICINSALCAVPSIRIRAALKIRSPHKSQFSYNELGPLNEDKYSSTVFKGKIVFSEYFHALDIVKGLNKKSCPSGEWASHVLKAVEANLLGSIQTENGDLIFKKEGSYYCTANIWGPVQTRLIAVNSGEILATSPNNRRPLEVAFAVNQRNSAFRLQHKCEPEEPSDNATSRFAPRIGADVLCERMF